MKSPVYPITDDHIHIDPVNGRGVEAAKDFLRAGGTHIFLVSKPSWSLSVHPLCGADYAQVFDVYIPRRSRGFQNGCPLQKQLP
jgi:TatD-related deoxyribonuclease